MTLLAAEHEFGARHGGVGNLFDALGLPVEFDGNRMRRFRGGVCGRAEGRDLGFERQACGFERAFRGFDVGFELRGAAGDRVRWRGRPRRSDFRPAPSSRSRSIGKTRGGRFGADIGTRAGFVEG